MGDRYAVLQSDPRYFLSRKTGYMNLIYLLDIKNRMSNKSLIIDMLAGNGTFSRTARHLISKDKMPLILGMDISEGMVSDALRQREIVFRGDFNNSLLSGQVAEGVISAYGTHHIPIEQRESFVASAASFLKNGGRFLLQDFLENTPTANWYSKIIDKYRDGGHRYQHFTTQGLKRLLNLSFSQVSLFNVYDPFCIEMDSSTDNFEIKKIFFCYLINLFSLAGMIPSWLNYVTLIEYDDKDYWRHVEDVFALCFSFSENEMLEVLNKNNHIPIVMKITVLTRGNKKILVAPRVALVGLGVIC